MYHVTWGDDYTRFFFLLKNKSYNQLLLWHNFYQLRRSNRCAIIVYDFYLSQSTTCFNQIDHHKKPHFGNKIWQSIYALMSILIKFSMRYADFFAWRIGKLFALFLGSNRGQTMCIYDSGQINSINPLIFLGQELEVRTRGLCSKCSANNMTLVALQNQYGCILHQSKVGFLKYLCEK